MIKNRDLTEDIRDYWSRRSRTFDESFGHHIPAGAEADAWSEPMRRYLPLPPARVLELACGTGEVTRLLHALGHDVSALDFSEEMLAVARKKFDDHDETQASRSPHFILANAVNTMEPEDAYDAVVCRHLVWTLVEPEQAFLEWFRVLRPGGKLLIYDGDWSGPKPEGRWAARLLSIWARWSRDTNTDGDMDGAHDASMDRLPFGDGLTASRLVPMLEAAGFDVVNELSHRPIAEAQRKTAALRDRLRTYVYARFIILAEKPRVGP